MLVNTCASSHRYLTNPESWPDKLSATHSLPHTLWRAQVTQRRGQGTPSSAEPRLCFTSFHMAAHRAVSAPPGKGWCTKEHLLGATLVSSAGKVSRICIHTAQLIPSSLGGAAQGEHRAQLCCPAWPLLKCSCPNTPPPGVRWCDPTQSKADAYSPSCSSKAVWSYFNLGCFRALFLHLIERINVLLGYTNKHCF